MATLEKPKQKKSKKNYSKTVTKEHRSTSVNQEVLEVVEEKIQNENNFTEQPGTSKINKNELAEDDSSFEAVSRDEISSEKSNQLQEEPPPEPQQEKEESVAPPSEIPEEISKPTAGTPNEITQPPEGIPEKSSQSEEIEEFQEKILELQITPSAPIFIEESEGKEVAPYPVLPAVETSQVKIQPKIISATNFEVLKPFTREELSKLYYNSELEASIEFENCFVQSELRPGAISKHPLHELISNYALSKEKLKNNQVELERLRKELKSSEESAWIIENAVSWGHGQCGDNQNVSASHRYQTCKLQKSALDEICRLQSQIYRLANENHLSCSYNVASLRVKVEHYLECAIHGSRLELRACLSVLFRWARIQGSVSKEARIWLGGVVSALLGGADWHDHAYILCHVLRCPAGVALWATPYIQVPLPPTIGDPFNNPHINHAVAVLGMLLRGVAARRDFLAPPTKEPTNWVLVDSDGEEDENAPFCLKENDLVSFLNQIPLGELLTKVLGLTDNGVGLDEQNLLRLYAFCRTLIDLLNDGLKTYGAAGPRYHQFCKRLCRLIGHILRYSCDAHELSVSNCTDQGIKSRLQIELDSLFLECAKHLHEAEKLGAWQFLAVLPFEALSEQALWLFLEILQTGDNSKGLENNFGNDLEGFNQIFEERLNSLSVEASYYLLNTYANIAAVVKNYEIIKFVTLRLLDTGFVSESTKDSCSKPAASLLRATCLHKPYLLSLIIHESGKNLEKIGPLATQLFRELPLRDWYPTADDIAMVSSWFIDDSTGFKSCLARLILSELNWGALPPQIHDTAALILIEQVEKFGETQWSWQLVHKLRLHATDRNGDARTYPDLNQIDCLYRGIKNGLPICNFLTVLMTQHGHLVPMICTHGITQLQILAQAGNLEAVCIAVGYIVPLFAECTPDTLANSQAFQGVVQTILNADRTYVKMAKNLVPTGTYEPGKFTQLLASAIEYNMLNPQWCHLLTIWLNIFLAQPQWFKDQSVLYLLDSIVRISFFDEIAYSAVLNVFISLLLKRCDNQQENGGLGLLSWVGGSSSWPPILIGYSSQFVWLSYACLEAEFEILERRTNIWKELLNQLRSQSGKTNVDSCLKKACGVCKYPSFSSANLCIYRWAQLALETSTDHPLLPCLWQNFFHLFLERSVENVQPACVGGKFFDGVINTTFCKKLKKRLQETAASCTDERRSKVYLAFSLWLDEPLIQDGSLYLPSLPTQYETAYLTLVLEQRVGERPWRELCDTNAVREGRKLISSTWGSVLGRDTPKSSGGAVATPTRASATPTRSGVGVSELPLARIKRRLAEYDKPLPPPTQQRNQCPVPDLNILDLRSLTNDVRRGLKQLSQHAELYALQRSEHQALDQQFRDLLPHLYKMCPTSITINKTCGVCTGSAAIHIRFTEARANDSIRNQLQTNKNNAQSLLSRSIQPISDSVISNCASIERAAINLHCNTSTAAELFFLLIELYEDSLEIYPPTRNLFRTCCQILGGHASTKAFSTRLCATILSTKSAIIAKITSDHFKPPNDLGVADFLQIYTNLIEKIIGSDEISGELLSRLDIVSFLQGFGGRTKLADRSRLIELIFKGLYRVKGKVHDLLRSHLISVFAHDFPEHYGEVIQLTLNSCAGGQISNLIFRDIILTLVRPAEINFAEKGPLISDAQLRQAVAQQKMLRQDVLVDTCVLLGRYFSEERKKHGVTYGLYPRYRSCISELAAFCSIVSHALVWTVVCGTGAPADRLVECTYAKLVEMYGPWLLPIQTGNTIAQPWLRDDTNLAQLMLNSLISCISFMLDAMPASRGALCQTWQLYCGFFARNGVHEHILRDVHFILERLPWKRHWPSVQDLETMARLITGQQLPLSHRFTCHIFLHVDWSLWLVRLQQGSPENLPRSLNCLLQLLIRLPSECEDITMACQLLETAQKWNWVLSPAEFSNACDWCVTTIDPRSILHFDDPQDDLKVDRTVLNLLSTIAGYEGEIEAPNQMGALKRQCYVRCATKLLINCAGRHKQLVLQNPQLIARTLTHHLDLFEKVVTLANGENEGCLVLAELFQLINCTNLIEPCLSCMEAWFSTRKSSSRALVCAWRTIFLVVANPESSTKLFEVMLSSYFSEGNPDWNWVSSNLKVGNPTQPPLELHLATSGRLLTLNAIIYKKIGDSPVDKIGFLDTVIDLSNEIRLGENIEPKIPLIYQNILKIINLLSRDERQKISTQLRKFATQLSTRAESKPGALRSVLGALTGSNKPFLTPQGRLLNRALAAYILAQLPTSHDTVRFEPNAPCHVGSTGGNQECSKLLLKMDAGLPDEHKHLAEFVLKKIQNPENSLGNALTFLNELVEKIYCKIFLNKNM